VLQRVAARCRVLQSVAVRCRVLQCEFTRLPPIYCIRVYNSQKSFDHANGSTCLNVQAVTLEKVSSLVELLARQIAYMLECIDYR